MDTETLSLAIRTSNKEPSQDLSRYYRILFGIETLTWQDGIFAADNEFSLGVTCTENNFSATPEEFEHFYLQSYQCAEKRENWHVSG